MRPPNPCVSGPQVVHCEIERLRNPTVRYEVQAMETARGNVLSRDPIEGAGENTARIPAP